MGKEIKDKVELEKIIDQYLMSDIPLSLLTETYNLTYPQIQLLINRTIGYTRQSAKMLQQIPELPSTDLAADYLTTPHEFKEEYPKTYEEVIALFERLEQIKGELHHEDDSKLKELANLYEEQTQKMSTYNHDVIARIENFLRETENEIDSQALSSALYRNGIGISEIPTLNNIYSAYLNDSAKLTALARELKAVETTIHASRRQQKKLEYEYEEIREKLVVCNVKLVNWCIRSFFNNIPISKEESQAYGLEALAIAINKFDYKLGFRFSTFAVPIIVHHIESHFTELYGMSWKNFCDKSSINYYRTMMKESNPDRTKPITPQELADLGLINLSARQIAHYDKMIDTIVPMSTVYPDINDGYPKTKRTEMLLTFEDYETLDDYENAYAVPDDEKSLEDQTIDNIGRATINEVLQTLTPREEEVLRMHFGLDDGKAMSHEEIGRHFHLSRGRIRQIEVKALRQLRHPSRSKQIRAYYSDTYNDIQGPFNEPHPNIALYNKLITLLGLEKSQESLLIFMNLDNLKWNVGNLNEYIQRLYIATKYLNEQVLTPDDITPTDIDGITNNPYQKDYIPREILIKCLDNASKIISDIETYFEKYNIEFPNNTRKK